MPTGELDLRRAFARLLDRVVSNQTSPREAYEIACWWSDAPWDQAPWDELLGGALARLICLVREGEGPRKPEHQDYLAIRH